MAARGMLRVIRIVVLELLFDDLLVVFLLFLFFAVTRAGAIRHGRLLMGGVVCLHVVRAGGRVGRRGDEGGVKSVRERLIILGVVHDFGRPL